MSENGSDRTNTGRIIEIKGVVIDAVFPDFLPEIYTALEIEIPEGDTSRTLVAEVQQHLGDDRVRAVAMDSTDGLARGSVCVDTNGPISVPVGSSTLGRLWNVIGAADRRARGDPGRHRALVDPSTTRPRSATSRRRSRRSRPASRSSTSSRRT